MQERAKKIPFEDIKIAAIAKAKAGGECDADKLEQIGEHARLAEMFRIGRESAARCEEYLKVQPNVLRVRESSYEEDLEEGIDKWADYEEGSHLPPSIAVQVKSSYKDVDAFKLGKEFKDREGMIMVLNSGPSVTLAEFTVHYESELGRIKEILKTRKIHFI